MFIPKKQTFYIDLQVIKTLQNIFNVDLNVLTMFFVTVYFLYICFKFYMYMFFLIGLIIEVIKLFKNAIPKSFYLNSNGRFSACICT